MSGQSATSLQRKSAVPRPTERFLSWGRYPKAVHQHVHRPAWNDQLPEILETAPPASLLPYGLGRSYGDSCLNAGRDLVHCRRLNRILGFDADSGMVRCESGVTLSDILDIFLPKGWFLPVTPGTRFVTLGGAIANDVYGKNQHRAGTFGSHVRQLALHRSDGLVYCSPEENPRMFEATVGGLGLTGVIAWADLQLKRVTGPWMEAETVAFHSLRSFLDLSRESDSRFEYTVAWMDCFSGRNPRGIFSRGNHSEQRGPNLRPSYGPKIPFALPALTFNRYTVQAFNSLYYHARAAQKAGSIVSWDSFFYPLDSIRQWNLLYGKCGFLQYQCVIPETQFAALEEILDRIARSGMGSFFSVLKQFGSAPPAGMLSFARPGLTFALDFAMRGESTLQLLQSLDEVVLQSGGALYPAKDARMSPAVFEASFPRWRSILSYADPKMSSSFWRRVTESQ
jgi:FAD/FMN-containing dehydrogenase